MKGPLDRILENFGDASSVAEIASKSQLPVALVRAGIDQLIRMGRIEKKYLAFGCSGGSCGSCSVAGECHDSGGLLTLRLRDKNANLVLT